MLAAREEGWLEIDVCLIDVDDIAAKRIVLADNRASDLAFNDAEALLELLQSLDDLEGTAYGEDDLGALLDEVGASLVEEGEHSIPPLAAEPTTTLGEVIGLGRHRLVCGDARDPSVYERLLEGEAARALWTDPPFGVGYRGKTPEALEIPGDDPAGLKELLDEAFAAATVALAPAAAIYVAHPAGPLAAVFMNAFVAVGWSLRQTLVWVKDAMVLGRSDYHYRHEPILYGFKPGEGRLGRGSAGWHGDNAQTSVFEVERPRAARAHPTMKPPALIEAMVRNSTQRAELVLDCFAGSGSTVVACERLGRRARLVEIDPRYCDVIVERFEALTGTTAERVRG